MFFESVQQKHLFDHQNWGEKRKSHQPVCTVPIYTHVWLMRYRGNPLSHDCSWLIIKLTVIYSLFYCYNWSYNLSAIFIQTNMWNVQLLGCYFELNFDVIVNVNRLTVVYSTLLIILHDSRVTTCNNYSYFHRVWSVWIIYVRIVARENAMKWYWIVLVRMW